MGGRLVLTLLVLVACRTLPVELQGGKRAAFRKTGGHLVVRAEADGQPLRLVLDTGASITAITKATATRLGIASTGTTPVNGTLVPTGLVRRFSIAKADHADVRVAVVDLLEIEHRRAYVDGVLGLDVLGRHDLVIDFRDQELLVHPTGTLVARSPNEDLVRIPFTRGKHGLPVLQVRLERDVVVPAILDLGSPVTYLNREAATRSGHAIDTLDRHRITLGDLEMVVPALFVEDLPAFTRLGISGPAMLIGNDTFGGRTLAIAYADGLILISR